VRDWLVGGGLVTADGGVLLVQNRRRDGRVDWSPPGGVIDPGETLLGGLTREVEEETGLRVTDWAGPTYEITAEAPEMGWRLAVEAHHGTAFEGEVTVDDPDGIVVAAAFVAPDQCGALLAGAPRWVREPLAEWIAGPWSGTRRYAYRVEGTLAGGDIAVHRLD
jgi:8-oxo-dGTP diphosphatase